MLEMIVHLDFSPVSDEEDTAFAIIQSRIQLLLDEYA